MSWAVYELDLVSGKAQNPTFFETKADARNHAAGMAEGWREGEDRVLNDGDVFIVMTPSGVLNFGALIREVIPV